MKRVLSVVLVLVMILSLAACGAQPKPTEIVTKYCKAMQEMDTVTMSNCLIKKDETTGDEEYEDYTGLVEYFTECAKQMQFEIADYTVSENKGMVMVKFKYVDAADLVRETLREFMLSVLSLAFSGGEPDDAQMEKAFSEAFESRKAVIKTGTSEKTVAFNCTKMESGWLIDEAPEEILAIMTCNGNTAFADLESAFDELQDTDATASNNVRPEVWHDVHIGETVELATIKITALGCEEVGELRNAWSSVQADPGTKFVMFNVSIENTTKQAITFNAEDIPLMDGQEREFSVYDNAWQYVNDSFFYTELAPNIPKTGYFIYQLPEGSTDYYFMIGKSGTNEGFRFWAQ